ncbi:RagB/SusD family nutrient uptake outer membrane protein [Pedobacter sp.]
MLKNRNKYGIKLLWIALLVNFCSCKKFLATEPKDFITQENYYETEEQLNAALTGVYSTLKNSAGYGNFMLGRMGFDADEGYTSSTSLVTGPMVFRVDGTEPVVENFWFVFYSGINRADVLLQNINKPKMDEAKRSRIKGETIFLKAYFYFLLVSRFGDVPYLEKPVASVNDTQIARTPSAQVYEKIVAAMIEAETLVPTATQLGFGGRINKSAVRGILARVYLQWAGYPVKDETKYVEARKWALKVIESGEHALNPSYQQIFINYAQDKYDIKESIWEIEFYGDGSDPYGIYGRVGSTLGIPSDDPVKGYVAAYMRVTGWLYRLYAANDNRRNWNIAPFSYSGVPATTVNWASSRIYDRYIGKWRREYELSPIKSTVATPQNYPLLRYSDVLLMYAEADNFINDNDGIQRHEALNKVRRRGLGLAINAPSATDLFDLTKAQFLTEIQNERPRELCFENHRKMDLVRWGVFLPRMKSIMNDFTVDNPPSRAYGILGFQNVTSRDVLWPIPTNEMTLNRLLTQNQGW